MLPNEAAMAEDDCNQRNAFFSTQVNNQPSGQMGINILGLAPVFSSLSVIVLVRQNGQLLCS